MTEPRWLGEALVRVIHFELISEHGGDSGIRDEGLLQSALQRPRNAWNYGERDLGVLAAKYGHGLSSNHPFVDGNKRIALAAIDVFLRLNGARLETAEEDAFLTIIELAAGRLDEAGLANWITHLIEHD